MDEYANYFFFLIILALKMTDVIVVSGGDRAVPKVSKVSNGSSSGVKTLSIIETLSELATDKTEASRLTLPSPIRLSASSMKNETSPNQHPGIYIFQKYVNLLYVL